MEFPLQVGNELLLQVQKSILGVLSFSEERVEWEISVDAVPVCYGEERTGRESNAAVLHFSLHSHLHLRSLSLSHD